MPKKQATIYDLIEEKMRNHPELNNPYRLANAIKEDRKYIMDLLNDRYCAKQVFVLAKILRVLNIDGFDVERLNSGADE